MTFQKGNMPLLAVFVLKLLSNEHLEYPNLLRTRHLSVLTFIPKIHKYLESSHLPEGKRFIERTKIYILNHIMQNFNYCKCAH